MIDDLQNGVSERNTVQNFLIDKQPEQICYQNVGTLTAKVMVLCLSPFYFGYNLTNLSTFTQQDLETVWGPLAIKTTIYALLIGFIPVGAFFGAGLAPLIMHCFSRKQFVLFINLLALIVMGIIQVNNIYVFLVCRFLQGVFVGCYMAITPIYIDELAPKQIVGSFGVFTQLFVVVGIVISYSLQLILASTQASPFVYYRVMMTFNAIAIITQSILLLLNYVPQSPCSLIRRNLNDQAKNVIAQFTKDKFVQVVFREKCLEVEPTNQQAGDAPTITEAVYGQKINYAFTAYLLGFELPFMQQLTGINGVVTQANSIVSTVIPSLSQYVGLIINGIQLIATISAILVLIYFGRKTATLMGNLALAIIDIVLAVLFLFQDWQPSGIIIFVLLIFYNIIYGATLGPIVWLYVPEIIPSKIVPFATMTNWLGASICVVFTPIVIKLNNKNPFPVFFFFGGVTILFYIMNVFLMVETKGKNKVEIAKLFRKEEVTSITI